MKTLPLILFVALAVQGCAGMHGQPESNYDRFTDTVVNSTVANNLPNHFPEDFNVTLDMRQEVKAASTNYFLVVGSISSGKIVMPAFGESLFIIADTNRFSFSTDWHFQSHAFGRNYFYPATGDQLAAIAHSTNAEIRIVSIKGGRFERKLAPKNLVIFGNSLINIFVSLKICGAG